MRWGADAVLQLAPPLICACRGARIRPRHQGGWPKGQPLSFFRCCQCIPHPCLHFDWDSWSIFWGPVARFSGNLGTMKRQCYQCGEEFVESRQPGRSETCGKCRNDLRVCRNCTHYDRSAAHECRERRADPVADKEKGTFCEYFEFSRRPWAGVQEATREAAARAALRDLLGD